MAASRWRDPFASPGELADARRDGNGFDVVVCSIVLCDIDDDSEALRVVRDLSQLVARDGRLLVAVCNPNHVGRSTLLQRREPPEDPERRCITWKTLRAIGGRRRDVHRPLAVLLRAFDEVGLRVLATEETPSIDPDTLDASSDFLILQFGSNRERAYV